MEEQRIAQRARAVETLLRRRLLPITITATGPSGQPYDVPSRSRLLSSGALLAGRLPEAFFTSSGPGGDLLAAELWRTAPRETARVLALLVLDAWPSGEAAELEEVADLARAVRQPLWHFADPDLMMAARAALRSRQPGLPFTVCALTCPEGQVRKTALLLAAHFGQRAVQPGAPPAAVLEVGRTLALEVTRAVRRVSSADAAPLRARLVRNTLAAGFPRILLPALRASVQQLGRRTGVPALKQVDVGGGVEVRLSDGAVLGRGRHAAHAWARALALLGNALERAIAPPPAPRAWAKLAPRLLHAPERRTLVLDITPLDVPGPPHDPLNRGPARRLAMAGGLLVSLAPGRRPSAREVRAADIPRLVLRETLAGTHLDFVARGTEVQSLEARLTRLARRVRLQAPQKPVAVEIGGDVWLVTPERFKRYPERTFARRPVRCAWDPEAPDFGVDASQGREVPSSPQLQCLAFTEDTTARLLTMDGSGWILREVVPLHWAQDWINEAQAILRAEPQSALSVRAADGLMRASMRLPETPVPDVEVTLHGTLPFGLELELDGERYGGRSPLPWSAAALAVLSRWPLGVRGRVRFAAVDVLFDGEPAGGLLRLYARSLAMRRLHTHIEALTRT
jgi:hypothetical protein